MIPFHSRQQRTVLLTVLAVALAVAVPVSADENVSSNTAPVHDYINSRTGIIGWIDVRKLDLSALSAFAKEQQIPVADPAELDTIRKTLVDQGVGRIYWVGDLAALMRGPDGFIIPVEESKREAVRLTLELAAPRHLTAVIDRDAVLLGTKDSVKRLQAASSGPLPEGFADIVNGLSLPHGIAVHCSPGMLAPLKSTLPEALTDRNVDINETMRLMDHIHGITASVELPPERAQVRIVTDSEVAAAATAGIANTLIEGQIQDAAAAIRFQAEAVSATLAIDNKDESVAAMKSLRLLATPARQRAANERTKNSLKQIAIAMHVFHDTYNTFPPQCLSNSKGDRLLSWRVLILPYLDQKELYDQFHLDEPWDSEHNRQLISQMPRIYQEDPGNASEEHNGRTRFVAPMTPNSIFGRPGQATRIRDIVDGTSNTLMTVQTTSDRAVVWTKPEDLPIDKDDPVQSIITPAEPGFHCNFADGSAHFFPRNITAKTIKALLSMNGGEVISVEDLSPAE
ncbi:MAG: DUF1559 domain-containing protein [Planctomycetaceae bacterium]|nr:DUF1559 domain-containing protein [Planctomycetaceae bacterium]